MSRGLAPWCLVAFGFVGFGAIQLVLGQAPSYANIGSPASQTPAGSEVEIVKQMHDVHKLLKANSGNVDLLPSNIRELINTRAEATSAMAATRYLYAMPRSSLQSDIELYCDKFYRLAYSRNGSQVNCRTEGYFLVLYDDGRVAHIDANDVRMASEPNAYPIHRVLVFPGMKAYSPTLGKLAQFDLSCFKVL